MAESESLETLLDDYRKRHKVPAIGAAIVEADGRCTLHAVGSRQRGSFDEVLLSDKWHIGSCTKSVTAALWARLVELGHAGWEDRLYDIFDDLSPVHSEWRQASISDALQCRAGLPTNFGRAVFKSAWRDTRPLSEQRSDVVERFLQQRPGELGKFVYSNLSYILVGSAIDRVSSHSFEEALNHYILDPLDIKSAGFGSPEAICGHRPRICLAGLGVLKGPPKPPGDIGSDNPRVFSSAGSLHLTLEDWSTLVRTFLVDSSTPLLHGESLEKIFQSPVPFGTMVMGWMQWPGSKSFSFMMQGSNTLWSATAALSKDRTRCVLIVCNDGRSRVLNESVPLAVNLLAL